MSSAYNLIFEVTFRDISFIKHRKRRGLVQFLEVHLMSHLKGDISLWLGRYHDIDLTTTAFDAEAVTKHHLPLIIYIELFKFCIVGLS